MHIHRYESYRIKEIPIDITVNESDTQADMSIQIAFPFQVLTTYEICKFHRVYPQSNSRPTKVWIPGWT